MLLSLHVHDRVIAGEIASAPRRNASAIQQSLASSQVQASSLGSPSDANEMCVEVRLDGPVDSAEIHYDDRHGVRRAGEFALECAELWIEVRGRRFGCYKLRSDAFKKRSKPAIGTLKSQRQLQVKALDSIAAGGESSWLGSTLGPRSTLVDIA